MQDPPPIAVVRDLALAQMKNANGDADAFVTRVATAALQLVERGIALGPIQEAAEAGRLSALFGETGDLAALNHRLCDAIRKGTVTLSTPGLASHLRATTMEKLAIDQPSYAAYRRAVEQSEG